MGDRSNVVIESNRSKRNADGEWKLDGTERVYLYSHWSGERVLYSVVKGLQSGRADDAPYLARIIAQDMWGDDKGETGFGISASITDNENPIIVLNADDGEAWFEKSPGAGLTRRVKFPVMLEVLLATSDEAMGDDGEGYWDKRAIEKLNYTTH